MSRRLSPNCSANRDKYDVSCQVSIWSAPATEHATFRAETRDPCPGRLDKIRSMTSCSGLSVMSFSASSRSPRSCCSDKSLKRYGKAWTAVAVSSTLECPSARATSSATRNRAPSSLSDILTVTMSLHPGSIFAWRLAGPVPPGRPRASPGRGRVFLRFVDAVGLGYKHGDDGVGGNARRIMRPAIQVCACP